MPFEIAAKTVLGIVDRRHEPGDDRQMVATALIVDGTDFDVARRAAVAEEVGRGRRENDAVMLGDDVPDRREMRRVVKDDAFLAVVHIEIVGDNMLAENDSVAEPLHGDVVDDLVVVLIARHHKADRMTGIRLERLAENSIADIVVEAELRIAHDRAGGVLQIDAAAARIHHILVEMRAKFKILYRYERDRKPAAAAVAFDGREDRPRPRGRIALFRGRPVGKKARVGHSHVAESRRRVVVLDRFHRAHLIGIKKLARHLALECDVKAALRRNHQLPAARPSVDKLFRGTRDAVALGRIGNYDLAAALRGNRVDRRLDSRRIVGDAVALRAEIADIDRTLRRQRESEQRNGIDYNVFRFFLLISFLSSFITRPQSLTSR